MKALIISAAALVAFTSVTLGSIPASAKSGVCQKQRSVAVGKDGNNKGEALFKCKTHLRIKGAATYGFDYWFKDPSHSCQELGHPNGSPVYDYWQCICSAYLCGEKIKLQIPPPSQSFRQKPDRDPEFGPSPGRSYLDMPNLGRFPGVGRGISPSRPRR